VSVERLRQESLSAIELPAEDPMLRMRRVQRATGVCDVGAQMIREELVFVRFDPGALCALEEEADHDVRIAAADEVADDFAEPRLATDLLERVHGLTIPRHASVRTRFPLRLGMELVYAPRVELPLEEQRRQRFGLIGLSLSVVVGLALLCLFFVALPVAGGEGTLLGFMCLGSVIAIPAGATYLTIPRMLDRYDPEPWPVLLGCIAWGAITSCGVAVTINTIVEALLREGFGDEVATAVGTAVCAPIVEESMKGLGVLGVFYFLRREFDGLVDGVIYAFFVALGFAAVENVVYYARAAAEGASQLTMVFVMRGVIAPWGHPVYTAMTGLGLGFARETTSPVVRWLAPILGYLGAVTLHAIWNGGAILAQAIGDEGGGAFFCFMLVLWLVFVTVFLAVVIGLVRRRKRILEAYLADEVVLKFVTPDEKALVIDAFGIGRARRAWGKDGESLVRATARLATVKWHAERAAKSKTATVSHQLIMPLRQEIKTLRGRIVQQQQQQGQFGARR